MIRFSLVDVDGIIFPAGDEVTINEPFGFSDFIWNLERGGIEETDEKTASLGFVAEFGAGESELGFDWVKHPLSLALSSPHAFLQAVMDNVGVDGNVLLRYYKTEDDVETLKYQWALIFKSANEVDDKLFVRVKRVDFGEKLRTRIDTEIDVESTVDLDDNADGAMTLMELPLHSRVINQDLAISFPTFASYLANQIPSATNRISFSGGLNATFNVEWANISSDSVENRNILSSDSTSDVVQPFLSLTLKGTARVVIRMVAGDVQGSGNNFSSTNLKMLIQFNDDTPIELTKAGNHVTGTGEEYYAFTYDGSYRYGEKGGSLRLYFTNDSTARNIEYGTTFLQTGGVSSINIDFLTRINPSTVRGQFCQDILSKAIQKATGQSVVINSEYLGKSTTLPIEEESETGTITIGQLVTGGTSGATGIITDYTADDFMDVNSVIGNFQKGETVSTSTGTAEITTAFPDFQYSNDDYGSLNFITTGKKMRGLTTNANLRVKIKDLIDFNIKRYGMGWQIVEKTDGSKWVVIEKSVNFFNDTKIISLSSVENPVRKEFNRDLIYNKFDSGFLNFAKENEDGSIAGFNTRINRLAPLEREKKELKLVTSVVADGAEIERVRRLEIKEDESDQSDDKLIIIKCQRYNSNNKIFTTSVLTGSSSTDVLGYSVTISGGNTISLDGWYLKGQADNATTITLSVSTLFIGTVIQTIVIDSISYDSENNKTVITTSTSLNAGNATYINANFYFNVDVILPERDQPFQSITGVFDSNSEYNMDHAPSQFLVHNWNIIGGGLSQKSGTKKMKFTSGVNDVSLRKAYRSSDNSYTTSIIGESEDILLSSLNSYNPPILKPFLWKLRAHISFDDWLTLRLALLGQDATGKNWGYVDFTDNFGNLVPIFPNSLKRNEKTGAVDIEGWERETPTPPTTHYLLREDGSLYEREGTGYIEREF